MTTNFDQSPRTEAGLRARRAEAGGVVRRGAHSAYFQATLGALVGVLWLASDDARGPSGAPVLVTAAVVGALGAWLARTRNAAPAAILVAIVLGLAVWQLASGGRPPALLAVAYFAWRYGQAFNAARELATLPREFGQPLDAAT